MRYFRASISGSREAPAEHENVHPDFRKKLVPRQLIERVDADEMALLGTGREGYEGDVIP
jgi:hypothetical protein